MNKFLASLIGIIDERDRMDNDEMPCFCQKCGRIFDYDEEICDFHDRVNNLLDKGETPPNLKSFWDNGPICADCAIKELEEVIKGNKEYN